VGPELQTEHRNEEADKEAAGITHIDPGGVKVVPKEAKWRIGQRYGQTGNEKLTVEEGDHEEEAARNGGHTRRQAVLLSSRLKALVTPTTQTTVTKPSIGLEDRWALTPNATHRPQPPLRPPSAARAKSPDVVDQNPLPKATRAMPRTAARSANPDFGGRMRVAPKTMTAKAAHDGSSTEKRHRRLVGLTGVRDVKQLEAMGYRQRNGREQNREEGRDREHDDVGPPGKIGHVGLLRRFAISQSGCGHETVNRGNLP